MVGWRPAGRWTTLDRGNKRWPVICDTCIWLPWESTLELIPGDLRAAARVLFHQASSLAAAAPLWLLPFQQQRVSRWNIQAPGNLRSPLRSTCRGYCWTRSWQKPEKDRQALAAIAADVWREFRSFKPSFKELCTSWKPLKWWMEGNKVECWKLSTQRCTCRKCESAESSFICTTCILLYESAFSA